MSVGQSVVARYTTKRLGLLKVWFPLNVKSFGSFERMEPCRAPIPRSSALTSSGSRASAEATLAQIAKDFGISKATLSAG